MTMQLVYVTCKDAEEADRIATAVVFEHLAACTNRGTGITSTYFWEGRLETSLEVLLLLKTSSEKIESLSRRIKQLHSYTTPAIIAVQSSWVDPDYQAWLTAGLEKDSQ